MTTPEQPGQGWQYPSNPYGPGPNPYEQQPYGGYGSPPGPDAYQQQPGPYGPPYGQPPRQEGPRTHAIVALVVSAVLALSCYVSIGGIIGAVLSGVALSKVDTDPQQARKLLKGTWIAIGANVGLIIAIIGLVVFLGVNGYLD